MNIGKVEICLFKEMDIRNDGGILSSNWYSKLASTGLLMNYHALAPKRYKRYVVQEWYIGYIAHAVTGITFMKVCNGLENCLS